MTLEQAIEMLKSEYERATKLDFVMNPLAYALHQVWKKADRKRGKSRNDRHRQTQSD